MLRFSLLLTMRGLNLSVPPSDIRDLSRLWSNLCSIDAIFWSGDSSSRYSIILSSGLSSYTNSSSIILPRRSTAYENSGFNRLLLSIYLNRRCSFVICIKNLTSVLFCFTFSAVPTQLLKWCKLTVPYRSGYSRAKCEDEIKQCKVVFAFHLALWKTAVDAHYCLKTETNYN